ncbi:hypothetical protein [Mesorhizobium sp.]|uniref:hypothetical protein n=1 Tax=Mesorhizobium sp. TaxID=1871066 RepID=UPI000FE55554|nr:hypothetical protein [Mesorhizobium sp.]RWN58468.1 MAG: hypothetical protein EOS00_21290 [Mesorhizobium sp.]
MASVEHQQQQLQEAFMLGEQPVDVMVRDVEQLSAIACGKWPIKLLRHASHRAPPPPAKRGAT